MIGELILQQLKIDYIYEGRELKTLCPFHEDKTPSLYMKPENGVWYCFGCRSGGSIKQFVTKIKGEGYDFNQLLSLEDEVKMKISNHYNNSLEKLNSYYLEEEFQTQLDFLFGSFVHATENQISLQYLQDRGFTKDTINQFMLMYAPTGEYEGRIIIPLITKTGCIGFNSRLIVADKSNTKQLRYKYFVNKIAFDNYIYNYQHSKTVIIVEGAFDLMWLYQNGFTNTISFLSTTCKAKQIVELYPFKSIIFLYDNDLNMAGDKAVIATTKQILKVFPDKRIYKASLPSGKDPNSTDFNTIKDALSNLHQVKLK